MATPLDQNFMVGFQQGANVVNNAQANAMQTMGGIQQMVARKLQMEQAAEMFPYQLESLRMEKEMNALKMEEAMRLKKIQLRNQGTLTALAQMAAEVPPGSPNFIPAMQRVAFNNPDVMVTPQAQSLVGLHYKALDQQNKVAELENQRMQFKYLSDYRTQQISLLKQRLEQAKQNPPLTAEARTRLKILDFKAQAALAKYSGSMDSEKLDKDIEEISLALDEFDSKTTPVFTYDPVAGKLIGQGVNPDWQPSTPATDGMPNNVGPWEIPPNQ